MARSGPEPDLYALLTMLRRGGSIVSSHTCSPQEVAIARADGRLFVDKDEVGYVYRPRPKERADGR